MGCALPPATPARWPARLAQVADRLEEAFEATGSRGGFMLGHVVSMPFDLENIVDLLVPELQRRGRFRREYRGRTLRDNLCSTIDGFQGVDALGRRLGRWDLPR